MSSLASKDRLDALIDLVLSLTEAKRDQLVTRSTNAKHRNWRDAIWLIAREDYDVSIADIAIVFGVAHRTVVNAATRLKRNPTAVSNVMLLRTRMARALRDLR